MGNPTPIKTSVSTTPSSIGGQERRVKIKVWQKVAESSARLNLLKALIKEKIGLNEIEEFSIGLQCKYKSQKFKNSADQVIRKDGKFMEQAMKSKLADEQCYHRELVDKKIKEKREIAKKLIKNSRPYRKFMKMLRDEEQRKKAQMTRKFKKKLEHLKTKYSTDKNHEEVRIPDDVKEFSEAVVFDKKKFEDITPDSYEVKIIGDIELSKEEEKVLKLHPKFCIVEKIKVIDFEQEQETSLAKLRMEFRKQEENENLTPEEIKNCEEFEARCRQIYDPETREFDARKKKATDLQECNRVTLPKPLSAENEAKLELRKTTQTQIFKEWLDKNTNKNHEQKSNLTPDEQKGLKSLQTRIKKGELIVIKTDKSSKFAVTNQENYIKMGQDHVANDKIINRQELIELEETLNGHSRIWAHMWGYGKDHKHFDRILTSKITHSENLANLYLMFKDHKEGTKTRPTATGHSSNSLGLSNSVAEILESIANAEPRRYNTISSEDMLSRIHGYNKKIQEKSLASQGAPEPWDPSKSRDKKTCIIGSDVKALYPSIKSEKTGKIVRDRVENSKIKLEGFNVKMGLAYIAMNLELTTEIDKIQDILPTRKSGRTSKLKMSAVKNDWDPSEKFEFKKEEYTPLETRQVQARVIEIATRALFENHAYKFGNLTYKQMSGGSIGDRWTGAAAELVMQDWAENYEQILVSSDLEVHLLAGYVDDGRQGTTILPPGMQYSNPDKKFIYSKEAEEDDKERQEKGETENQRMARLCVVAMNSINEDLEFTVECEDDYPDKKLPTLDFKIWQEADGKVNHTYYQKPMKTPFMVMSRSAAPKQQKFQVLSNELTRRLLNVNRQENGQAELNEVVNQFTKEARNSEYGHHTTLELVISGIRAWKGRLARRKELGQEEYRTAASTLKARTRKKLTSRENWYKNQENQGQKKSYKTNGLPGGPRALGPTKDGDKNNDKINTTAVMFVPYTTDGKLAKMLRKNEEKLVELTGTKLKIVERTGTKLVDILTSSNPWQGQDCTRKNCLLCHTKTRTDKLTSQDCSKRNIVYEITCTTCEQKELEEIENSELDDKIKLDKKNNLQLYKYIGESSRSSYERGWEHINDLTTLNPRSHMLKHILAEHPKQDILSIEFSMKVRKFCTTSFERQVLESVTIQQERNAHNLMNSKSEYNRCSLPRLSTKMGEQEYDEYNKNLELEKQEEELLDKKIREMRKSMNKARLHPTKEKGPKPKRRKIEDKNYVDIQELWGETSTTRQEKIKKTEENDQIAASIGIKDTNTSEKIDLKIPKFPPMPPRQEISQLLPKKEQFRQERLQIKESKEKAYELQKLCYKYLTENDKDWAKKRQERIEERERLERLEKTRILSKNAKIKHLEGKIKTGMEKIPIEDKIELENKENEKIEQEQEQIRQDMWKLRKKEKKLIQTDETRKIQSMAKKLEKIKEILDREKLKRIEIAKLKKKKVIEKQARLKLQAEKAEKWAMLRWINEYIAENKENWENLDLIRTQEKYEEEEKTRKLERLEIVKSKKRKYETEDSNDTCEVDKFRKNKIHKTQ